MAPLRQAVLRDQLRCAVQVPRVEQTNFTVSSAPSSAKFLSSIAPSQPLPGSL